MACYHPSSAWRDSVEGAIYFGPPHTVKAIPLRLPCGNCVGCLKSRAFQWSVRCMHEASLYEDNSFITLTYNDEHLPSDGSLDKRDFQLFMKKLRKAISPTKVRYFCAGEYGSGRGRPHFHVLLFGFAFPDRVHVGMRGEHPVFRSALLERVWSNGFSEIGTLTIESAGYVASYIMKQGKAPKKIAVDLETGEDLGEVEREFALMSRGGRNGSGIGSGWIDKWRCDVYPRDGVIVRGRIMRPPRYYDLRVERDSPEILNVVREKRRGAIDIFDSVQSRLAIREVVAVARDASITRKDV